MPCCSYIINWIKFLTQIWRKKNAFGDIKWTILAHGYTSLGEEFLRCIRVRKNSRRLDSRIGSLGVCILTWKEHAKWRTQLLEELTTAGLPVNLVNGEFDNAQATLICQMLIQSKRPPITAKSEVVQLFPNQKARNQSSLLARKDTVGAAVSH